ncbi:hypothetical protein, partial [Marispirochaeta sp.]|uniref:hypothetical protein n=1 Tax=Marispirochaeta sp. TaxID=2038653 RepID=UPI0029C789F6
MRKPHTQREHTSSKVPVVLRQLLVSEGDRKQELKEELQRILADPRELLTCGILDPEHRLYKNAQTVDDALESVTNGMEDPSLLEQLRQVPDDSLVGPWKNCVLSLKALYDGDLKTLELLKATIPPETPPHKLADMALSIASGNMPEGERKSIRGRFAAELLESPDYVGSAGDQMEDALEMGLIDLFADTAAMLVRDIERDYPEAAEDFALWCFSRLAMEDQSPAPLLKRFKGSFTEAGCLRLAALGIAEEDADAALYYWLRFLITLMEERRADQETVAAALSIAAHLGDQGILKEEESIAEDQSGEDLLLMQQFHKLLGGIREEILRQFEVPGSIPLQSPQDCRKFAGLLSSGSETIISRGIPVSPRSEDETEQRIHPEKQEPQQLELFA